ncbi:hypothetical protein PQX77_016891, partial [Marasmius sp. AFHP31]
ERNQLRAAYLSQHHSNVDCYTYFIDEVGFSLVGDFSHTPPAKHRPAHLFVSPLPLVYINGMHCIRYPLPKPLFHWASDPEGRHVIPENSWARYGVPELDVQMLIGSCWVASEYKIVRQHLVRKEYRSNGKQYALDHGYPELIRGDPHEGRLEELRDSDEGKPFHSETHLTSSSTFSLINAPSDVECTREEEPSITTCLAKGCGLWNNTSDDTASGRKDKFKAVSQTDDTDGWDFVESDK